MRIDQMRPSGNVEDRRGFGGRVGGGGGRMVVSGGIGSVILLVLVLLLGGNPLGMLGSGGGPSGYSVGTGGPGAVASDDRGRDFVARVLGDTEDVWTDQFAKIGRTYRPPTLVLFTDYTETACGGGDAATGPFYCPADQKVYIDLSFYRELSDKFGAPGDFAPGVRHRSRGGAPHPEPAGHQRPGPGDDGPGRRTRTQRALGAP
ncbi:MAG TPA: neutral zinc metallopeptidase [Phycisphaerales bacterium]|nr:neutral zinc metallopeptidase [Phycisphaerales bacterium]